MSVPDHRVLQKGCWPRRLRCLGVHTWIYSHTDENAPGTTQRICAACDRLEVLPERAPCGDPDEHYVWRLAYGWPCPVCAAQRSLREQEAKRALREREMAASIAELVRAELARQQRPGGLLARAAPRVMVGAPEE
jgi:hypothetical protein